ncbi:sensor domain-containing diguanylate cyclase [Shewanella marinintestina]|uniref:sensor domain-containing diguanylate cyclase n=1 Tax=Shewanella marinintestina TaxID=190305 RepID=UPI00200C0B58|nr:sensor domain-containing diguanylate cyclase [Shewanella marinintestina]MCL1145807.1 sensor domain-containing diguanylate cyclase [Shewanella marinintestina]
MVETALEETTNHIPNVLREINKNYAYTSKILAELYAEKLADGYQVDKLLLELQSKQRAIGVKQIGLVDSCNGLYLDTLGRVLQLDISSARDQWVQEFIDGQADYRYALYDPDELEYESLYSFYYDHKIKDDHGKTIGILGIGLNYEDLYQRIQGLDNNIDISFLNLDGDIRLPKNNKGKSVFSLYPNLSKQQFDLIQQQDQILWSNGNRENYLVYFHYLADINRILLLKMDNTDYYNNSRKQYFVSFLIGLALIFTVAILNLFYIFYQNKRLNKSAFYDLLTGCYNRNYLENRIKLRPFWRQLTQAQCSMLVFDIDYFKHVNDSFGHLEGDKMLKQVASVVRNCLRESDHFIRWGGDEFLVLIEMPLQESMAIANRIQLRVEQETSVTLSLGITDITSNDSFQTAMKRADSALYEAKDKGRNQVRVCCKTL